MLESIAQTLRSSSLPPAAVPRPVMRPPSAVGSVMARVPAHVPPHAQSRPLPWTASQHAASAPVEGAERDLAGPLARCMVHMLDEIDYGMLLVDADAQVLYLNHAARRELDGAHPLQMAGRRLLAADPGEATKLQEALGAAQRGLRRLLTLGRGEQLVGISVVPLVEPDARAGTTLLMLGKRAVCEQLTVQGYARARALTPAETRVLELLCGGVQPTVIAKHQGVAVSTVRTQIGSIRAKTGANSIRELVRQVAVLPPLVGALRQSAAAFVGAGLRLPLAS